ncbi:galactosylceramide sulfotransferase-like [Oratosquilla oratoria]|uniref:galactosylceramide sulfotransferase-like n=1 Tax=Oratosquilla oratoria TaxID=337810 RepID=UPI003F758A9A
MFAWMNTERNCSPVSNVAFLKNHKCASSTVQNILLRYAWHHHLRIVCPKGNHLFNLRIPFAADMAKDMPWHDLGYNVFAVHAKWNHKEVVSIMPEDTIYITIVREPVSQFESLYNYIGMGQNTEEGIKKYLRENNRTSPRCMGSVGLNQMTWDFGLALEQMDNMTAVHELVAAADSQFDFVMVTERMDESLVLLKNLLCWSFEDVVALKLNARNSNWKTDLNSDLISMLRLKLEPDFFLYNHFRKKFDNIVEQFGYDRMTKELTELRQKTVELTERCSIHLNSTITKPRTLLEYKALPDDFCNKLVIPEGKFVKQFRDRLMSEYKEGN